MERERPQAPFLAKIILWLFLACVYLPLFMMFIGAVWAPTTEFDHTNTLTLIWFQNVFSDADFMRGLLNSIKVATVSSFISTALCTLASLALIQRKDLFAKLIEVLHGLSLVFPEIVFALSLLACFYLLKMSLGLTTTTIAHVTFSLSFVLMTLQARASTLEKSLTDAAEDLGANPWQILFWIHLPLMKQAILAGFLLSFILSFDDFLITFFVGGVGSETLPVMLYSALRMGVTPKLNALSSMMFLITFSLIFLISQTKIVQNFFVQNDRE